MVFIQKLRKNLPEILVLISIPLQILAMFGKGLTLKVGIYKPNDHDVISNILFYSVDFVQPVYVLMVFYILKQVKRIDDSKRILRSCLLTLLVGLAYLLNVLVLWSLMLKFQ